VTIANTLHLEAAGAMPTLSRFNYDARSSVKSLNLFSNCRIIVFFAADTLLYAVTSY